MMYRLWGAVLFDFMWMMQISCPLRFFAQKLPKIQLFKVFLYPSKP